MSQDRPNILYIMDDQHRARAAYCGWTWLGERFTEGAWLRG